MVGYAVITNIDKVQQPYTSYLWAILNGYNRKASEAVDWTAQIIGIPNSTEFGLMVGVTGDYTIFRKHKTNGTPVAFANISIDCQPSLDTVFVIQQTVPPSVGFNFTAYVQLVESGGNVPGSIEYGFALSDTGIITNWQDSNTFNLINEGVYFFDVRVKNQAITVGRQSIELYLNQASGNFGGGDESDNLMPGTGSSED